MSGWKGYGREDRRHPPLHRGSIKGPLEKAWAMVHPSIVGKHSRARTISCEGQGWTSFHPLNEYLWSASFVPGSALTTLYTCDHVIFLETLCNQHHNCAYKWWLGRPWGEEIAPRVTQWWSYDRKWHQSIPKGSTLPPDLSPIPSCLI